VSKPNIHDSRESWLRAATNELRPFFAQLDLPLPATIRFAIAFTSRGKRTQVAGETWYPSASADGHHEIIIRCDFADPLDVLGILVHELVHVVLPATAKHGKVFKAAALRVGLEGKMIHALPGPILKERLQALAATLGPLPHAKLDFENAAADRPKKQGTRMLKAACESGECGYTVRVAASWVRKLGPPHCPRHGPMQVDLPAEEEAEEVAEDEKECV
jgi:hypothetical protein